MLEPNHGSEPLITPGGVDLAKARLPISTITHTSEQVSRNAFRVHVPLERVKSWEWWLLLTSDRHWDNPHSNHEMQLRHLQEAKARGAAILDAGDFFCAMQGKYDVRSSKAGVRPEHQTDNYLDALVKTASDFFEPYAHHFITIGTGNHEEAIQLKHETNLIDRLSATLNDRTGSHLSNGGYGGWVRLMFEYSAGVDSARGGRGYGTLIHYDHGFAGGGQVTKDVIQHQRRATYLPDADIVLTGHTHDAWVMEFPRVRISLADKITHDIQTHIKLPTYKDEYGDGYAGWAVAKKGMPPKPLGAWWLRFYWDRPREDVLYDVIRAK